MNRRDFMKASVGAAALLAARGRAYGFAVSPGLAKFIDPLPMFGANIPVLTPNKKRYPGVDYYEIVAGAFRQSLSSHMSRVFPGYTGTRLYGYAADVPSPTQVALGAPGGTAGGDPGHVRAHGPQHRGHVPERVHVVQPGLGDADAGEGDVGVLHHPQRGLAVDFSRLTPGASVAPGST